MPIRPEELHNAIQDVVLPALRKHRCRLDEVRGRSYYGDEGAVLGEARREIARGLEARGWSVGDIADFAHRDKTTILGVLGRTNRRRERVRDTAICSTDEFLAHLRKARGGCVSRKGAELLANEIHRLRAKLGDQHANQ